jgi:hypothetical protein
MFVTSWFSRALLNSLIRDLHLTTKRTIITIIVIAPATMRKSLSALNIAAMIKTRVDARAEKRKRQASYVV